VRGPVRGDTDHGSAARSDAPAAGSAALVAPAATELIDRAERATTMVEVQALLPDVRQLPGVRGAGFTLAGRSGAGGRPELTASRPVGPLEWRQTLRADLTDPEAHRLARGALDAIVDAAGRALRLPCRRSACTGCSPGTPGP
jgi:hypothetical protein